MSSVKAKNKLKVKKTESTLERFLISKQKVVSNNENSITDSTCSKEISSEDKSPDVCNFESKSFTGYDECNNVLCASDIDTVSKEKLYSEDIEPVSEEKLFSEKGDEKLSNIQKQMNDQPHYDIGYFIGKPIDDLKKRQLLLNYWQPPKNYKFPFSEHTKQGKIEKRYASHKHLSQYDWLILSDVQKGYFFRYCALFINEKVGHNKVVTATKLLVEPVTNFAKLFGNKGVLSCHESSDYHKMSIERAKIFLLISNNSELSLQNQINQNRQKEINENRKRIVPIIKTIIFLGRQNIALRGHRDYGPLTEKACVNEGNFRELLRFRIDAGDLILQNHLKTAKFHATYISKEIQNELISVCGDEIISIIVKRVQDCGIYSVIFDETTDAAKVSQMTVALRYVYEQDIREDFIGFFNIRENDNLKEEPKVTGNDIGNFVLNILKQHCLLLDNCVGIGTDGCITMVSEAKGAVAKIQSEAKNAAHCLCQNHSLNLTISQSSKVREIRNSVGTMQSIITFLTASPKRNNLTKSLLGSQLLGLCETRWIERHEAVSKFRDEYTKISEALEMISTWSENDVSSKARSLLSSMHDTEFLMSVFCLSDVLSHTIFLSRIFQKTNLDISTARSVLIDTLAILEKKRDPMECQNHFHVIFQEATKAFDTLGIEIKLRRTTNRQIHRSNYPAANPEDFFRLSIYIPLLDNVILDIKTRFAEKNLKDLHLSILLPENLIKNDEINEKFLESVQICAERYSRLNTLSVKTSKELLLLELQMWKETWSREKSSGTDVPITAGTALQTCDKDIYPMLFFLLKLLACLPVSVASAERTFSALRRLKTWIRSTMNNERLSGLAMLHVHQDIPVDVESIIDRFAKMRNRKTKLLI